MTRTMTKTTTDASSKDRTRRSFPFGIAFLKRAAFGTFLAISVLAFLIILDGLIDDVQPSDAAVILGSKVELTGRPSARLAARLDRGMELYKAGITKTLIVSGGTGEEGFDEAIIMRDYLLGLGVPPSAIIVDSMGFNTEQTAKNCATIMKSHNFKSVIVVTQYFHITRTRMALKANYIDHIHSAHARYFEIRDIYSTVRETVATPVYWLRAL